MNICVCVSIECCPVSFLYLLSEFYLKKRSDFVGPSFLKTGGVSDGIIISENSLKELMLIPVSASKELTSR